MTDLAHRAEQAVLGAIVTDPGRVKDADGLRVADFTDPRHQAIFAALTCPSQQERGIFERLRDWLAALQLRRQAREIRGYMADLPGWCPEPGNLPSYARMLTEARKQREQATQTEPEPPVTGQLDGASAWLDQQSRQAAIQARRLRPAPQAGGLPRNVELLARTLQSRNGQRPRVSHDGAAPPVPEPAQQALELDGATSGDTPRQPAATRPGEQSLRAEDLQELVLADLLQRPGDAEAITGWLPASIFTPGSHREIYGLITGLILDGKPVDPLIVAWQAHHHSQLTADSPATPHRTPVDPEEVLRIGALHVMPGTGEVIGRALLADHLYTTRFGPDWPASPWPDQLAAAADPVPDPAPDPAPEPAACAALEPAEEPDIAIPAQHGAPTTQPPPPITQPAGREPRM